MPTDLFMVFDVESVGLHGEGFAVGWVVVDRSGKEMAAATYECDSGKARGICDADIDPSRKWVAENVRTRGIGVRAHPSHVRDEFWRAWLYANEHGATLWADCCWPVEARFLDACVEDDPETREWQGPYPLYDVATLRLAAGLDPLATVERLPSEMPQHDPLADARQSARLLIEALKSLGRIPTDG